MKCPKCGSPTCKYVVSRRDRWRGRTGSASRSSRKPRDNFEAKCGKCGFEGEIK